MYDSDAPNRLAMSCWVLNEPTPSSGSRCRRVRRYAPGRQAEDDDAGDDRAAVPRGAVMVLEAERL
jgi:hypothetical protein